MRGLPQSVCILAVSTEQHPTEVPANLLEIALSAALGTVLVLVIIIVTVCICKKKKSLSGKFVPLIYY